MQTKTTHHLSIRAPWETLYRICTEVARWPEWFEPCHRTEILEESAAHQLVRIAADANGQRMEWVSRRTLDRAARRIEFRQTESAAPIRAMVGAWRFEPNETGQTLVTLEHDVAVDPAAPDAAMALATIVRAIDRNSTRELAAIRRVAEEQLAPLTFEDHEDIPGDVETIYACLANPTTWTTLLPHCRAVDVRYDDGRQQEFVMTVDTPRGPETIRTIRRCRPTMRIEYFQPTPPRPLLQHTGQWELAAGPNGVRLTAAHTIRIDPSALAPDEPIADVYERARGAIGANSRATIRAIARHCAATGVPA